MSKFGSSSMSLEDRWVVGCAAVLVILPAWLRGGTQALWTKPMSWVALLVLIALGLVFLRRNHVLKAAGKPAGPPLIRWRDPVPWFGLLLLALLCVQWWNAGRALYFDPASRSWEYSLPRHPAWPSAITTAEARQMIDWFFPAIVLLVMLRSPAVTSRAVRALWRVLVYNAGVLCVFGLTQYFSGTSNMFWWIPMRPHFFATFGYPNHAGSYFLISLCVSAALLIYELAGTRPLRRARVGLLSASVFFCLMGANFALSRLSIILGWLLLIPIGYFVVRALWPRMTPVQRLHGGTAAMVAVILAGVLVIGLGHDAIRTEFKPEDDNKTFMDRETTFRWFQIKTAAHMWWDHPVFGVGGWGYRYLLSHYLPPEEWRRITEGKANVHNDPIQFLAEFGLAGAGSMAGIAAVLILAAWRARKGWPPMVVLPCLGVGLVAAQSMIDLPFRSSAVLALWLAVLAGASRVLPPPRKLNPPQIS